LVIALFKLYEVHTYLISAQLGYLKTLLLPSGKHSASLNVQLDKHHEAAYWHPWNLAWFETDCAIWLGPEIKNMR
jgi:hypothetical protein